ncbi:MAG: methyltransferase domain-containing protein [Acidimicrobiales bacterium]
MRQEVEGFSKVAPQYERGRPDYPAEAADWIAAAAGLGPGRVVVDLAAGTGKLTRQLVRSGGRVIAVEPLPEMLSELISVLPQVEVVIGTAEATGLPDAVADVVAVGQAFHWFSTPAALSEIARLLVPNGHLALVWNRRDPTQELQADLDRIMARFRHATPSYESGAWTEVMDRTTLFEKVAERRFGFVQALDADGLSDRVASTSFIANLAPEEHAAVLQQVRELVPGDSVELAYECTVYLFRKR